MNAIVYNSACNNSESPTTSIFDLPGPWAGVGSRETPDDVLFLMVRYARTVYDLNLGRLHSGDAIGADFAFWVGAKLSANFDQIKAKIFLSRNGYQNRWHNRDQGFINALTIDREIYRRAIGHAYKARGGFYGLGTGGKQLMTRNAFQVLDEDLLHPVRKLIYWGIPQGKTEKVRGGTNCALQIAIAHNIPRINLYHEQAQTELQAWLQANETQEAYPDPDTLRAILYSRRTNYPTPPF